MTKKIDPDVPGRFGSLELLARQVVEGFITGLHKSPFHGSSVEFAEHRIYNPGESTRNIDWKLFARTDKLFVKRFEEETNLRCQLVIDSSSSMHYPLSGDFPISKLGFSVESAASLAYLLRKQRDAVGLSILSDHMEMHTPARSSGAHHKMIFSHLDRMYSLRDGGMGKTTKTASLLHVLAERIHQRSLVIIFSDMLDNDGNDNSIFPALQHLKHNKHEVIVFHVMEREKELNFSYKNRPYQFVDMETGHKLRLNPSELRSSYVAAMNDHAHALRLKCMQYQIDYVPAAINGGFEDVLMSFLIKRSRLY